MINTKWINLSLILFIILILILNDYYFQVNPARLGEHIGITSLITIGFWFLTLIIPSKFTLYHILSSLTFILLIPLICTLIFTYDSYRLMNELTIFKSEVKVASQGNEIKKIDNLSSLKKSDLELMEKMNKILADFNAKFNESTTSIMSSYQNTLITLNNNLNVIQLATPQGRANLLVLLQTYQKIVQERNALNTQRSNYLLEKIKSNHIEDPDFWSSFNKSSDKVKLISENINRYDNEYINSIRELINFFEKNAGNYHLSEANVLFNTKAQEAEFQKLVEQVNANRQALLDWLQKAENLLR